MALSHPATTFRPLPVDLTSPCGPVERSHAVRVRSYAQRSALRDVLTSTHRTREGAEQLDLLT
jgi:hypothetical protein